MIVNQKDVGRSPVLKIGFGSNVLVQVDFYFIIFFFSC